MAGVERILAAMRNNPANIDFRDACKIAEYYFGEGRQTSGSHCIYKMPWQGDPRVNLQPNGKKAKIYQVRQLLKAIDRLKEDKGRR